MKNFILAMLFVGAFLLVLNKAHAHCDTLDGPVVEDARMALQKSDVTPILKWVKAENEPEVRTAFNFALAETSKGKEAKENAEMKLFETLVRIHRAGEGASFTGLKPAGSVEPIVAKADESLAAGSVDVLTGEMSEHLKQGVSERFNKVVEKKKHMNDSVEAGREYVAAYVEYMHYAEGVHKAIAGAGAHHHEESAESENEERDEYGEK